MSGTTHVHVSRDSACHWSGNLVLEAFLEIIEVQRLLIIIPIQCSGNIFLLSREFILHSKLVIFCALGLWCNHKYVMEGYNDRVVIVQVLGHLKFLGQQESILLNHFINHFFYHSQVLHYVVLSYTLALLQLLEPLGCFVVFANK